MEIYSNTPSLLKAMLQALKPEVESLSKRHYRASLELREKRISLSIEAKSLSKLQAALNSYLRWTDSIKELSTVE